MNTYAVMPDNVIALLSFEVEGLIIDSQEDADRCVLEMLPLCTANYEHYSELIKSGEVHAVPRWNDDGKTLELSLIKTP